MDALFPAGNLKDDVMKIMPVQKQTSAGQRTRFVCYVAVGDSNGHIGLGKKAAKEVPSKRRARCFSFVRLIVLLSRSSSLHGADVASAERTDQVKTFQATLPRERRRIPGG